MISLSLCMIVRNEETTLGRCLYSVGSIADEIIIVDTGSDDRTKDVAKQFTHHVYDFAWVDDFAAARNHAFGLASKDYIMWLDADDVVLPPDGEKLGRLKADLPESVDAVTMSYSLGFDSQGNVTFASRRERLVKRSRNFRWHGAVHEYLAVSGSVVHADIAITHMPPAQDPDPGRNLRIYESRVARGEVFSPRDLFYYANELVDHGRYERAVEFYEKFLATGECWIEDAIGACGRLADCFAVLGRPEEELVHILKPFGMDIPRAEFCCRLGFYWMKRSEWRKAIFWYRLALTLDPPSQDLGFVNRDVSTWLPHIQLCVCYDHLGEYRFAYEHNEMARSFRPDDPQVLQNKAYLETVRGQGVAEPPTPNAPATGTGD